MAKFTTTEISQIWTYLGDIYSDLSEYDKELMQVIWAGFGDLTDRLLVRSEDIHDSYSLNDCAPTWTDYDRVFNIVYDSTDEDLYGDLINTYIDDSGYICYNFPKDLIISVSGVNNIHYVDAFNPEVSEPLVEGVDFELKDFHSIIFLNDPPFTPTNEYTTISSGNIQIDTLVKINPLFWGFWCSLFALTTDIITNSDYLYWGGDKYWHYKRMIEGLNYWRMQKPTLSSLKSSLGIILGLPFSYEAGTAVHSTVAPYTVTIGDQVLTFDTEVEQDFLVSGDVNAYTCLISGLEVVDYQSEPVTVLSYLDASNSLSYNNTLVFKFPSGFLTNFPFTYNGTWYDEYSKRILPKSKNFFLPTLPDGVER